MTVRSEVIALLDTAIGSGRNYADRAPENEPRPHTTTLDHIGQTPQLKGDARTLARRRQLQVDLWLDSAGDNGTMARTVENALDGAALTAGLRLVVTESHRVAEVDYSLSHFIYTCETTVLR